MLNLLVGGVAISNQPPHYAPPGASCLRPIPVMGCSGAELRLMSRMSGRDSFRNQCFTSMMRTSTKCASVVRGVRKTLNGNRRRIVVACGSDLARDLRGVVESRVELLL